jgi:hypothetical protein
MTESTVPAPTINKSTLTRIATLINAALIGINATQ